jgi:TDG/mug DNA glycosylase family protein
MFTNEKALPDIVAYDLKVLFVGYNPGIQSAKNRASLCR